MSDILSATLTASLPPTSTSPEEASAPPEECTEDVLCSTHPTLRQTLLAKLIVRLTLLRVGQDVISTSRNEKEEQRKRKPLKHREDRRREEEERRRGVLITL